jgi:hypothetical protein
LSKHPDLVTFLVFARAPSINHVFNAPVWLVTQAMILDIQGRQFSLQCPDDDFSTISMTELDVGNDAIMASP